MRILFLTPQIPYPPTKGTALRNWGLISGLAKRHDVAVLSFIDPGQSPFVDAGLRDLARTQVVVPPLRSPRVRLKDMLLTRSPDMALRLVSEEYAACIHRWSSTDRFDVVHVEGIELAPYIDIVRDANPQALIVFDDHNCEYLLQKRAFLADLKIPRRWPTAAYSFVQWRRLRRFERRACRQVDRVLAVSEGDAAALIRLAPGLQVTVVPNGIDLDVYHPGYLNATLPMPDNALVFTGTMDFRPNVDAVLWFAQKVLPEVRGLVPDVHFFVVGQRPHPRLHILCSLPSMTVTGVVDDPRPYIAQAAVYVVPLRVGGGTRLKLLESMAMGKAVVSTRLGAEGYPVVHDRDLMLADTPAEFASTISTLLRDAQRRERLGAGARRFVEDRYGWNSIVPTVEHAYQEVG